MHVTVYGPFFFMETTITGIVYLHMLQQFLIPQLGEDDQEGCIHFQQDGAPPHYFEAAPIAWPLRSPDLTPLDFFLWGFVKGRVFVPPLHANVAELRTRITAAVAEVTSEMLPHYKWKSHRTRTIRGKTRVLLYYDISKHCTCPLNKFIYHFKVVKLFFKHPIFYKYYISARGRPFVNGYAIYLSVNNTHVSMESGRREMKSGRYMLPLHLCIVLQAIVSTRYRARCCNILGSILRRCPVEICIGWLIILKQAFLT
jgi:hypothetical protein